MAKKLAVDTLALNSLNLETTTVDGDNKLKFNDIAQADSKDMNSGTIRISKEEVLRGSYEGSLDTRVSAEEVLRASKVISTDTRVSAEEVLRGSYVTSLTTRVSAEEVLRGSYEGSLDTRVSAEEVLRASKVISTDTRVSKEEVTRESQVSSLDDRLGDEEITTQILTKTLTTDDESITVTYANEGLTAFGGNPAVSAMIRYTGSDATAPIVVAMRTGTANATDCTFAFSEAIPQDGNGADDKYKIDFIITT